MLDNTSKHPRSHLQSHCTCSNSLCSASQAPSGAICESSAIIYMYACISYICIYSYVYICSQIRQGIKLSFLIILQFRFDRSLFAAIRRYHRRFLPSSLPLFAVICRHHRRYLSLSSALFAAICRYHRCYLPLSSLLFAAIMV